ncbi:MAG: RNA-binding domain-containing protein [Deltaproteobacteria bacterium]
MSITQIEQIKQLIEQGENSAVEFKSSEVRPESLAKEIVAFANSSGGTILIGVEDSGKITGVDQHQTETWVANIVRNNVIPAIAPQITEWELSQKKVLAIEVSRGLDKPYQTLDGKFWIRVGSTNRMATKEELSRLFQQAGLVHFDIAPLEQTSITDLDDRKLQEYWFTYYSINYLELEQEEQKRLLRNADILGLLEGEETVTVGGMLLFGKDPQRRIPQSFITFAVFDGLLLTDELLDKQNIGGTLPELIQQTHAKTRTFVPKPSTLSGMQRVEVPMIPDKVIREALVNAVCHRDYSISNRRITVYVFRDRLEISSPGRLPNTLNLEKILTGNSAPRNQFLLNYLDNMKYIVGLGRGVPMIARETKGNFLYSEEGEILRLVLPFQAPVPTG